MDRKFILMQKAVLLVLGVSASPSEDLQCSMSLSLVYTRAEHQLSKILKTALGEVLNLSLM